MSMSQHEHVQIYTKKKKKTREKRKIHTFFLVRCFIYYQYIILYIYIYINIPSFLSTKYPAYNEKLMFYFKVADEGCFRPLQSERCTNLLLFFLHHRKYSAGDVPVLSYDASHSSSGNPQSSHSTWMSECHTDWKSIVRAVVKIIFTHFPL